MAFLLTHTAGFSTAVWHRLRGWARGMPGRLTLMLAGLLVLGTATGLVSLVDVTRRSDLVDRVISRDGPLTARTQELYLALSDADTTMSIVFLSTDSDSSTDSGVGDLRSRYRQDIATAAATLVAVARADPGADSAVDLSVGLPVYTALVEEANTYRSLNQPIATAALREAAVYMRDTLLPLANDLRRAELADLNSARARARDFPWPLASLGALCVAGLVGTSVYLALRTRRALNLGLVVATLSTAAAVGLLASSYDALRTRLAESDQRGTAQVELLSNARVAALRGRSDEALNLVARGDGTTYEGDFNTMLDQVAGPDGVSGLLGQARDEITDPATRADIHAAINAVATWRTVHADLVRRDTEGDYEDFRNEVLNKAIGAGPTSTQSTVVDRALGHAIGLADDRFRDAADRAGQALTSVAAGIGALVVVALLTTGLGLWQRIEEYR